MSATPYSPVELFVSYSQIAVFGTGVENPFNRWTDNHVMQGFSWRPESVCFRTLEESGTLAIEVSAGTRPPAMDDALRAVRVPFKVPSRGLVEIATVTEGHQFRLRPGTCNLLFLAGRRRGGGCWGRLAFLYGREDPPAILVADGDLDAGRRLLMEAEPAT